MLKRKNKGYILIEVLVSVVCLLMISMYILETLDFIEKDKKSYRDNKKILKIMYELEQDIKVEKVDNMLEDRKIDGYVVKMQIDEPINDNFNKYKVSIYEDDSIKAQFYIVGKSI